MGLYGYPSCAERASSSLRTPTVYQVIIIVTCDGDALAWKGIEYSTDLADDENRVVVPTTTRVILYFHVRNLYCCTYSRLEFLGSDWHVQGYASDHQIRFSVTSDASRAADARGMNFNRTTMTSPSSLQSRPDVCSGSW
jgi:hypothetical protein